MNELTEDFFSVNRLLEMGLPFAIYRAPEEKYLHIIAQNNQEIFTSNDIVSLNDKEGFVIAPFRCSDESPVCLIRPDFHSIIDISKCETDNSNEKSVVEYQDCPDDYKRRFDLFSEALQDEQFEKLVLSRSFHTVELGEEIDVEASFLKACNRYKHSYVYIYYTPITGIWMGSTPEILLSNATGKWMTVALAGTQSLHKGDLPQSWDIKNKVEQDVVSAYIRRLLLENDIASVETKPYSVKAGELSHLRTDFCFEMKNTSQLGNLINQLHPTPAVCGMPKIKAYRFILDHEGYDRKYYSGFVGMISPTKTTELYVNLRCVNFDIDNYTLYAGGGLLPSSVLQDEWIETEKKMQTMRNILITK